MIKLFISIISNKLFLFNVFFNGKEVMFTQKSCVNPGTYGLEHMKKFQGIWFTHIDSGTETLEHNLLLLQECFNI